MASVDRDTNLKQHYVCAMVHARHSYAYWYRYFYVK